MVQVFIQRLDDIQHLFIEVQMIKGTRYFSLFWNVLDNLGHLELTHGAEIYTESVKPFKLLVGIDR